MEPSKRRRTCSIAPGIWRKSSAASSSPSTAPVTTSRFARAIKVLGQPCALPARPDLPPRPGIVRYGTGRGMLAGESG
ncbi:hypothetical protein BOS5A_120036 [Bosea sp. EC-HK365B]|nr:hypothetical protein BOSE7B_30037 [Bosea sp. 7B]VVT55620.1 hypothetical protein BOS5A_120036 [Bosea sp. EC-HK365B]VXC67754.1 hypothetical protein BOSE127_40036 [Bosea sp. 127]